MEALGTRMKWRLETRQTGYFRIHEVVSRRHTILPENVYDSRQLLIRSEARRAFLCRFSNLTRGDSSRRTISMIQLQLRVCL